MISLRQYLFRDADENTESAYRRIIGLFLQGIALHAVEGDRADYERFREDIDKFEKVLSPETSMSELLLLVGGAVRAMEDYNQRTSKFVRRQNTELQNMVSMLTQTVISIGDSSEHSVSRLQNIEKALERTCVVEDIQVLKLRLSECLEAVREEAVRQKQDGQSVLQTLRKELESSQDHVGSFRLPPDLDAATGLPGRVEAEKAIQAALTAPAKKFLLIAVCSRVQAVNARFGYAVGDRVLKVFTDHFKKGLSASDRLFRWQGPALLAVIERAERIDRVRAEIRQFADVKLEKTMEVGQRTVLIPITASWSLFPIAPPREMLLKQIEVFTAAQTPRDYA
jgi:GGDEF domain-containing protein